MSLSPAEQHALEAIESHDTDLDRWRIRVRELEVPQPGSQLAGDDRIYLRMPISEFVRSSLASAGEHLRLTRDSIRQRQIYASSQFTALRGALVAASQALWILHPDDAADRVSRGLCALTEVHRQMRTHLNEVAGFPLPQSERDEVAAEVRFLDGRIQDIAKVRKDAAQLNQTEMIRDAIEVVFPDEAQQQAGRIVWRQMGSDAHALGWALWQRGNLGPADRATGLSVGAAAGSLQDVAQPYECTFRILRRGWSLYDRRCEAP